ncbi:hypothetical protein GQR58_018861 [Nymphon striatum]|nr:hypothetical protein GQR58_018861 [Nymphon striatum]
MERCSLVPPRIYPLLCRMPLQSPWSFHLDPSFQKTMVKNLASSSRRFHLFPCAHLTLMGDGETISDYLLSVGMEGLRDELLNFARFAHASQSAGHKSVRSSRDMINLALKHKDIDPGSAEVAARFLIAPVSTVECERGLSKQNLIKTCLRNSMSVSALDDLMRISIDGPSLENFDFKAAFKVWAGLKTRRILV